MSRKRTKQYLMLLMVVGLVSIAAGGSGTFASFSAETTNAGNYFATGTLILNDNGGTNTCTSAIKSANLTGANSNNLNTTGTNCDTLFNIDHFTQVSASVASLAASATSISYSSISGPIFAGDSLTISDANHSETLVAATNSTTSTGAGTVTVNSGPSNSYTTATLTDNNPTYFATLTLTNAGTIDAKGISFDASNACTSKYTEGHGTLSAGVTKGVDASVAGIPATLASGDFAAGQPVVVTDGTNAQTFIATGPISGGFIPVQSQAWNFAYSSGATVSGPEFNGATANPLCDDLSMSIVETTSSFAQTFAGALSCAWGKSSTPIATNACDISDTTNHKLSSLPGSLTALTLSANGAAGSGNSNGELMAGKSRYFLLAVHYPGGSFDNTFQNTSAANLDLTWHIDQA